jgi:ligand-binding sensor domain-containing protein
MSPADSLKTGIKAFLGLLLVMAAAAGAPAEYHFSFWTADDGLPQNSVYAILQTRDGYLWFTTLDGLVRFDGVSFTTFSKSNVKELKSNRFNSLLEDSRGDLWIGTEDGGLNRYHAGRFFTYTTQDGLPRNAITGLLKDSEGFPVVVTAGGLVRWQGNGFVSFPVASSLGYQLSRGAFATSGGGIFWYADDTALKQFSSGQLTSVQDYRGSPVFALYADSRHNIWLGTIDAGLVKFKDGVFTSFGVKDGLPSPYVTSIVEDRDHNLCPVTRSDPFTRIGKEIFGWAPTTGESIVSLARRLPSTPPKMVSCRTSSIRSPRTTRAPSGSVVEMAVSLATRMESLRPRCGRVANRLTAPQPWPKTAKAGFGSARSRAFIFSKTGN